VGGLTGKTDRTGTFTGQLPAGSYTLTVSMRKYKTSSQTVQVTGGQTLSITVRLSH
jgi:hypothetical protein